MSAASLSFFCRDNVDALSGATRDQLTLIAGHYKIDVSGPSLKAELLQLVSESLLACGVLEDDSGAAKPPFSESPIKPAMSTTPSKAELELRRLELREKELEWERERSQLEADRFLVREREKREHELKIKELEFNQSLCVKELEMRALESGMNVPSDRFDVTPNIRLVPPFNEEVDKFFAHFERVATVMKWPRTVWSITLQSIFCAALSLCPDSL